MNNNEMSYSIDLYKLKEYASDNGWLRLFEKRVQEGEILNTIITYQVQDHIYTYTFKGEVFQNVYEVSK
jgi:hypothetical protein